MALDQSDRIRGVQAPVVPLVERLIRSAPDTISLGQGMVAFGPPPEALAALGSRLEAPAAHRYGPVDGLPELIAAIEAKLETENGIEVGPSRRIVVTAGGNMAFLNAVLAIADPGDEIILLVPYYFNHEMAVGIAGCRSVLVPTDDAYQPRLDRLRAAITRRTRAIVTVSPNNPTGAVYPATTLRGINALCAAHGLHHIHDEVYEYFLYDGATHFSPGSEAGAEAHTISLYSFSKAYGLASWRVGYMVIPAALAGAIDKIQDTNLVCPPTASQLVAHGALGVGARFCQGHLGELARVRRRLLAALDEVGDLCVVPRPDGAFYCLIKVRDTRLTALEMAERLVREHRVAVIPGSAFGLEGCSLRVAYGALAGEAVEEGARRLVRGLRAIVG